MGKRPLFSVAVMLFEHGSTWKACVDSILSQTYGRIELIVCDDSSCDFCEEEVRIYIERNKNERIEHFAIIEESTHVGPTLSRKVALNHCTGELINFLPGDCRLANEHVLEDAAEFLTDDEKRMVVAAWGQAVSPEGEEIDRRLPENWAARVLEDGDISKQVELVVNRPIDTFIFAPAVFWKREMLEKIGGFDERFESLPEWPLYLKTLQQGTKIDFLNQVAVIYRYAERYSEYELPFDLSFVERNGVFEDRKLFFETLAYPWVRENGTLWMKIQCWLCIQEIQMMAIRQLQWSIMTSTDRMLWKLENPSVVLAHKLVCLGDSRDKDRRQMKNLSRLAICAVVLYITLMYAPILFGPRIMEIGKWACVVAFAAGFVFVLWMGIKRMFFHIYYVLLPRK